jgi:hypothetical protein
VVVLKTPTVMVVLVVVAPGTAQLVATVEPVVHQVLVVEVVPVRVTVRPVLLYWVATVQLEYSVSVTPQVVVVTLEPTQVVVVVPQAPPPC